MQGTCRLAEDIKKVFGSFGVHIFIDKIFVFSESKYRYIPS